MSVASQAIAARRRARQDRRYNGAKRYNTVHEAIAANRDYQRRLDELKARRNKK